MRVESADHHLAARRAGHQVGREVAPDQRSRHQAPAQLREDEHRLRHAEADAAAGLGQAQAEDAHLGEVAPERAVEAACAGELAERVERDPPFAEGADPVAQRLLIVVDSKVHAALLRAGRGCARR